MRYFIALWLVLLAASASAVQPVPVGCSGCVVALPFWGQDSGDGSGLVAGSLQQRPSGPYTIYVYTGNSPQNWLYGSARLDPSIVPNTTVQNKCDLTLATAVDTYYYGYTGQYWPHPTTAQMAGNFVSGGSLWVNVYTQSSENLKPWSVYVINLDCPPLE